MGNLAYWCRALEEPVVAIAGMDLERSEEAARCGAAGVAVLRGIAQATDPKRVVLDFQTAIEAGRAGVPMEAPDLPRSTFTTLAPAD
jgi:hydroxymethylpyrimidine kinase/phosphomethylpyrimidine kinase/thiamine-phosphate diphosphorylase